MFISEWAASRITEAQENHAIELDLSETGLSSLPETVLALKNLRYLKLANNEFEIFPSKIRNLEQLEELDLNGNLLSHIPDSIMGLHQLQRLHLNGNLFSHLPRVLCRLPKLSQLNMADNDLAQLPEEMTRLQLLKHLNLAENQLTYLPRWLLRLTQLTALNVSGNRLCQAQDWLVNMPSLQALQLQGNPLEIPAEILESSIAELRDFFAINRLSQPFTIMINYATTDDQALAWLKPHLKAFEQAYPLDVWDDLRFTQVEQDWMEALDRAAICLLLVSPDFLSNETVRTVILPQLQQRATQKALKVYWLPTKRTLTEETLLQHLQAAWNPDAPLYQLEEEARTSHLQTLVQLVDAVVGTYPAAMSELEQPGLVSPEDC